MSSNSKNNGCSNEELLVSVLYGEATQAEREEFTQHARSCASCADEIEAFGHLRANLREWAVERVPAIKIEIRPGLLDRLVQSLRVMPVTFRFATAGMLAMLMLAVLNADISVGPNGFQVRTSLLPRSVETTTAAVPATPDAIERLVAERCDQIVAARVAAYETALSTELDRLQQELVAAQTAEVRQISVRLAQQRRQIQELQRDVDRQAGYGGGDMLFGAISTDSRSGS
jgi:hypothetical protein